MNNTTRLLIFVIGIMMATIARTQDISAWVSQPNTPDTDPHYFVWGTHVNDKFSLDVRHGFDAVNTLGAYFGTKPIHPFGNDTLWVIVEAGGLLGDQQGFGPEILAGGSHRSLRYFMFHQYVVGTGGCNNFYFTYNELHAQVWKPIRLGLAGQMFWPGGQREFPGIDIGPQAKIKLGKYFYVKPWYTWNTETETQKIIIGFGYTYGK